MNTQNNQTNYLRQPAPTTIHHPESALHQALLGLGDYLSRTGHPLAQMYQHPLVRGSLVGLMMHPAIRSILLGSQPQQGAQRHTTQQPISRVRPQVTDKNTMNKNQQIQLQINRSGDGSTFATGGTTHY